MPEDDYKLVFAKVGQTVGNVLSPKQIESALDKLRWHLQSGAKHLFNAAYLVKGGEVCGYIQYDIEGEGKTKRVHILRVEAAPGEAARFKARFRDPIKKQIITHILLEHDARHASEFETSKIGIKRIFRSSAKKAGKNILVGTGYAAWTINRKGARKIPRSRAR